MGFFKRVLGICETRPPANDRCWLYSGGEIEIELALAPELSQRGGAIRLEGRGLPERVLVLRGSDDKYYAFKNRCTHMGRRIDPLAGGEAVRCCSVSKSTFDYGGEVVSGPAKGPLETFDATLRGEKLIVPLPTA